MRSKHFLGLCLAVGGLAAAGMAGAGCSGGGANTGGAGGTGSTSVSSSRSSSSKASVTSVSSSSGASAPNPTCDTAIDLKLDGKPVPGMLPTPIKDERWYTFKGKKGDPLFVYASGRPSNKPFDSTYLDTNVTLYSSDCKTQIAQDDDPHPDNTTDASLTTILPADGTYYLRVAECNSVFGSQVCADPTKITTFDFTVGGVVLDPTQKSNVKEGPEPNDTTATATDMTMKYEGVQGKTGQYYLTEIYGFFDTATDVDVYKVSLPADLNVDPMTERPLASFYIQDAGVNGDGATVNVGKATIFDANDPVKPIATIDIGAKDSRREITPPVKLGSTYYLFVARPAGMTGTNDFYVLLHGSDASFPVEKSDVTNSDIATPETLTTPAGYKAGVFVVEGDINAASDLDHYVMAIPNGATTMDTFCNGQRVGSGVRGLTMELLKGSAGNGSIKKLTEDAATPASAQGITIPNGETKIILKVNATANPAQDPNVSGTFYRCAVIFS